MCIPFSVERPPPPLYYFLSLLPSSGGSSCRKHASPPSFSASLSYFLPFFPSCRGPLSSVEPLSSSSSSFVCARVRVCVAPLFSCLLVSLVYTIFPPAPSLTLNIRGPDRLHRRGASRVTREIYHLKLC